jgi:hypothetical protein
MGKDSGKADDVVGRKAPYPPDTRAKGWRFELDYEQVEQSDTWGVTKPEARPWLLMLWMTAWKQVPCGSLPADHEVIAGKIGAPDALWKKHKATLLRGWWLAEDGRLYHNTLATRVAEMMRKRRSDADRQASKRAREASDSDPSPSDVTRDSGVSHADVMPDSGVNPAPITDNRSKDISTPSVSHLPADAGGQAPRDRKVSIACPYDAIVDAYHGELPSLPRVKLVSDSRKRVMRKLWAWVLSSRKGDGSRRAETGEQALQWLRGYFAHASRNDFLMGRTPRSPEHAGWQCDIDFLMTERGMKQVLEKTVEAAA